MKPLFIPVYSKISIDKSQILQISKKLPKNLVIAYSIQYEYQAKQIKQILSKNHNILKFIQVLGCSKPIFPESTQAILLIGDGRFHAVSLAFETKLPIYIYTNNQLTKIAETEIKEFEKKKKAAYVKFLNAKKIGILMSTKPGQQNLKKALELKNELLSKDKEPYILIGDNINTAEFENFPEIQSWVNTACPRLDMNDARIVNLSDIKIG